MSHDDRARKMCPNIRDYSLNKIYQDTSRSIIIGIPINVCCDVEIRVESRFATRQECRSEWGVLTQVSDRLKISRQQQLHFTKASILSAQLTLTDCESGYTKHTPLMHEIQSWLQDLRQWLSANHSVIGKYPISHERSPPVFLVANWRSEDLSLGWEQKHELTIMGIKIKCHMNNDQPPCMRCKTRGTTCTVNKSLQTLLEGDASYVAHDPRLRMSLIWNYR